MATATAMPRAAARGAVYPKSEDGRDDGDTGNLSGIADTSRPHGLVLETGKIRGRPRDGNAAVDTAGGIEPAQ